VCAEAAPFQFTHDSNPVFTNETTLKYIEANGATPSVNPMAGNNSPSGNGSATAVQFRINGTGDLLVCSVATGTCTLCLVPPPPK
jgi:hypothetical protein